MHDERVNSPEPGGLVEGSTVGSYRIEQEIGRGGVGIVYRAVHTKLEKKVAIKVLGVNAAANSAAVGRLLEEGRTLARLRHPNVVSVTDCGEVSGLPYLVLDYIEGGTVETWLRRENGRLGPAEVCRVIDDSLEGLRAAHAAGIVHRDLKPSNLLLGSDGRVRISDFGLAQAFAGGGDATVVDRTMFASSPTVTSANPPGASTGSGMFGGTIPFMAPELHVSPVGDARSDVFAIGVITYYLLTGRKPAGKFAPASRLVPGLARGWDEFIDRCIAQNPTDRFQSAEAALRTLQLLRPQRSRRLGAMIALALTATAIVFGAVALKNRVLPRDAPRGGPLTADKLNLVMEVTGIPNGALVEISRIDASGGEAMVASGLAPIHTSAMKVPAGRLRVRVLEEGVRWAEKVIEADRDVVVSFSGVALERSSIELQLSGEALPDGTTVLLDGKEVARSSGGSVPRVEASVGRHQFVLDGPGVERVERVVVVRMPGPVLIPLEIRLRRFRVGYESLPDGTEGALGAGEPVRALDGRIMWEGIPYGDHSVRLTAPGRVVYVATLHVDQDKTQTVPAIWTGRAAIRIRVYGEDLASGAELSIDAERVADVSAPGIFGPFAVEPGERDVVFRGASVVPGSQRVTCEGGVEQEISIEVRARRFTVTVAGLPRDARGTLGGIAFEGSDVDGGVIRDVPWGTHDLHVASPDLGEYAETLLVTGDLTVEPKWPASDTTMVRIVLVGDQVPPGLELHVDGAVYGRFVDDAREIAVTVPRGKRVIKLVGEGVDPIEQNVECRTGAGTVLEIPVRLRQYRVELPGLPPGAVACWDNRRVAINGSSPLAVETTWGTHVLSIEVPRREPYRSSVEVRGNLVLTPDLAWKRTVEIDLPTGVTMALCRVEPGEYDVGSTRGEFGRQNSDLERTRHRIETPYYMGRTEVTRRQYAVVMAAENGDEADSEGEIPIVDVSYREIARVGAFLDRLNRHLRETKQGFQAEIPTELEWEVACRAGEGAPLFDGSALHAADLDVALEGLANYGAAPLSGGPTAVGRKLSNAWGLVDTLGNVAELTLLDRDPSSRWLVLRGGSWRTRAEHTRCASRQEVSADRRAPDTGFRLLFRALAE